MEILKKDKKIVIVFMFVVFLVGVMGLIYVNVKKGNKESFEVFYNDVGNGFQSNSGNVRGDNISGGVNGVGQSGVNEISQNSVTEEESKIIYIHIIGEVKNQGIVQLEQGQRLVDAIEKAGGATECADLSKVNLAYALSDGQKVVIPNVDENVDNYEYIIDGSGNNSGAGGFIQNSSVSGKGGSKVNINTATQTELETLNGIGSSTAMKIIEYRQNNGKFEKIEDLKNVNGIGEARFDAIRNEVVVK